VNHPSLVNLCWPYVCCDAALQITEFATRTFYRHYRAYSLCYRTKRPVKTVQHELQVSCNEIISAILRRPASFERQSSACSASLHGVCSHLISVQIRINRVALVRFAAVASLVLKLTIIVHYSVICNLMLVVMSRFKHQCNLHHCQLRQKQALNDPSTYFLYIHVHYTKTLIDYSVH
jgi:hypothetical protein